MTDTKTRDKRDTRNRNAQKTLGTAQSPISTSRSRGYVHRWIRVAMRGEEDKMNVHSKLREGWEPVRKDEYPDYEAPTIDEGRYEGVIGQGGLMLCRIPEETARKETSTTGAGPANNGSCRSGLNEGTTSFDADSNSRQSRVSFGGSRRDSD